MALRLGGSLGIVSAIGKEDSSSRLFGTSNRPMSHSTSLFDDMTDVEEPFPHVPNVPMYWFPEVSSTMDTVGLTRNFTSLMMTYRVLFFHNFIGPRDLEGTDQGQSS